MKIAQPVYTKRRAVKKLSQMPWLSPVRRGGIFHPLYFDFLEKKHPGGYMTQIYAVDSIMGTGKTNWAIKHMNCHKEQRFIYCTPFIDEVNRILSASPHFRQPTEENAGGTKQADFLKLLEKGACIATTHELFKRVPVTERILTLIREQGYTLILDEVIDVVEKLNASRFDLEDLQRYTRVEEGTQRVIWTAGDYEGNHRELKRQIKTKCVVQYKGNALLWLFPISIFQAFREIYILTFLFKGSCLEQYLLVNGLGYKVCHIDEGETLVPGKQPLARRKQRIVEMLEIYEGHLNEIGNKRTALSASWWKRRGTEWQKLMDNTYNLLRNIWKVDSSKVLWTLFKGNSHKDPTIKTRWKNRFCPCNARATNEWGDSVYLAYLVNMFPDPSVKQWFADHGGCIDDDQYALSNMLQWIWRSAIRNNIPVKLYIPSRRMRGILKAWLEITSDSLELPESA